MSKIKIKQKKEWDFEYLLKLDKKDKGRLDDLKKWMEVETFAHAIRNAIREQHVILKKRDEVDI